MPTTGTPTSAVDLFADESLLEPYPAYRELRAAGPLVYLERHEAWAVTRFDAAREVLRDWERFASEGGLALNKPMNESIEGAVLAADPPLHTQLRRVLSDRLSPGAMTQLNEQIFAQADAVVAELLARGEFDGVRDLAAVFPITVVADLIGIPDEGRENLRKWANAVFDGFGPENPRTAAAMPLIGELMRYIGETATRDRLTPGSMGMAVYEAADRGEIEPESCMQLMRAYLAAGMDTTINAIGNGLHAFAENPEQLQALKRDPSLLRSAGNEILRYDSPVQLFGRVATAEQTVAGTTIAAGEQIVVLYGCANRDESKWAAAESFDVTRNPIDHLGFGHGIHRCAGSALARLEIEALFDSIARRADSVELVGPVERRLNNTVRGLGRLPLRVRVG